MDYNEEAKKAEERFKGKSVNKNPMSLLKKVQQTEQDNQKD